jgi:hypothetical protein
MPVHSGLFFELIRLELGGVGDRKQGCFRKLPGRPAVRCGATGRAGACERIAAESR